MMGGVDLKDQLLQYYLVERKKLHKCYMKFFRKLLNATMVNAIVIYNKNNQQRSIDHLAFRVYLVVGLLLRFSDEEQALRRVQAQRHSSDNTIPRLCEQHFISRIPPSGKDS
ncbi:PiggyBac transposable element-derived protein 4 [Blattella germanica]|nr:PiggyBac transposable element-derived protein 4 [Blattella germanica]